MSVFRREPTAVWAVAFAAVVSFMGLVLVDPILPAARVSAQAAGSAAATVIILDLRGEPLAAVSE